MLSQLAQVLPQWYEEEHRDLPWRQTKDPYKIWVSEIMLQQTRVEAVRGYYARFLRELPTVEALAACGDDRLHKLWEGLGYYSRVRNLKKAAGILVRDYGGRFPREPERISALPGIGPYTTGAICSIAFDLPTPAVDGNVLRLVSRLTADDTPIDTPAMRRRVTQALAEVYPARAGQFTQALMELGATLCGPNREPQCQLCPCREFCLGYRRGIAASLPAKSPRREKTHQRKTVFLLHAQGKWALRRRENRGLLAGLWEFPNVPEFLDQQQMLAQVALWGLTAKELEKQINRKHIFTHIVWEMQGIYLEVAEPAGEFTWLTEEEIHQSAALPTAFRLFWEERNHV